ncbi:Pyridoxamine 5'-phosphate oxidase [Prauserella marina]|uniref:Pyridoxamine 5'-phosphate oxidase n=1 Tax=Prauserella marina TaxID=530584 RepID=A0A1G6Q5X6_9PSEU|nr:pyridoxamine 5'-phosphate oxidase family protein [Prauserella marina]PWV78515.1 pyridoxamine 5'-phosphate oxidase [Prauserella marina]SDC87718.1 Pyridoxamine 5'-phosphate oxidase [Prauserella marina]
MQANDHDAAMRLPQGDVGLLRTEVAAKLLDSKELARVAYVAKDGTPRVVPMLFHWTGTELVLPTFAGAHKIGAITAKPDIAVTIDINAMPPEVLLLRGAATVTEVEGILDEYALAQRRYYGEEQAEAAIAQVNQPGVAMARIALRPTWVGVLDFRQRLPGVLAGGS